MRELRRHANRLYEALDTVRPSDEAWYEYELVNEILTFRAGLARASRAPRSGRALPVGRSDVDEPSARELATASPYSSRFGVR